MLVNAGAILAKRDGGASRVEVQYVGTEGSGVEVTGGSLTFAGGGRFAGGNTGTAIQIDDGVGQSSVRLVGADGPSQVTVSGELIVASTRGGEFVIGNGASLRADDAALVHFELAGARGAALAGGTLGGAGHFFNNGTMRWESGTIGVADLGTDSARLFNRADGALEINAASGERILAGTLNNRGNVQQQGVVKLSGGRIENGNADGVAVWTLGADVLADASGGHFENVEGGKLVVKAGVAATIAADFDNRSSVVLEDGSALNVAGAVTQNALGILTSGHWTLGTASRLSLAGGPLEKIGVGAEVTLSAASVFDGMALAANDGKLVLRPGARLETPADFANAGSLEAEQGSSILINGTFDSVGELRGHGTQIQTGKLNNRGHMVLDRGASLVAQRFATNTGHLELREATGNGGQIFANAPGAVLILDNANLNAVVLSMQGTLRGAGVLNGEVHQFGTLAPGQSPGTIEINGDFIAEHGSTLSIEFAGLEEDEFDVLEVHGDATLGGTLEIRFLDGYLPKRGDLLAFLAVDGALEGAFMQILFPGLAPGFDFTPQFVDGKFAIAALSDASAVPLPASLVLLGGGIAVLARRRRGADQHVWRRRALCSVLRG